MKETKDFVVNLSGTDIYNELIYIYILVPILDYFNNIYIYILIQLSHICSKTHSASLYATYMRTEKEGFHSQNSLFVLCTTVNILQY